MTVVTPEKITVPESVRRKAGIKSGDRVDVEFVVPSEGSITIHVRREAADDEYTSAERRALDRGINQSLKEYREGKAVGPFETAEAFLADLHRESEKLAPKKKTKRNR